MKEAVKQRITVQYFALVRATFDPAIFSFEVAATKISSYIRVIKDKIMKYLVDFTIQCLEAHSYHAQQRV